MITIDMVRNGYHKGVVKVLDAPTFWNQEPICNIGDPMWAFYFAGSEGEGMTAADYLYATGEDDVIKEIFEVLDSMKDDEYVEDEYAYYESVLREEGC